MRGGMSPELEATIRSEEDIACMMDAAATKFEDWEVSEARRKGYVVGAYGEPAHLNPHNQNTVMYTVWRAGWENGHAASERMKTRKVRAI